MLIFEDLSVIQIDCQVVDNDDVFLIHARSVELDPAQQRFDVCQQFSRAERLGQVVVSAQFQTYNAIHFFVQGGKHQDRDNARCADSFAYLPAIHFGQHNVQNNQIGLTG